MTMRKANSNCIATLRSVTCALAVVAGWSTASLAAADASLQVHVHQSGEGGIFANAYLVETRNGVVAIDATLSNAESKALRAELEALHKPLLAVLLTHGHPDHYNGVTNLIAADQVPVVSTAAVAKVIRRDDAAKEAQWKPVFKDDWPARRTFPDKTVSDGETLRFDGVAFTVRALGPGESDADSIWIVTAGPDKIAFIGDVVLQGVHAFMSDGHSAQWLKNIERVRGLVRGASRLYPGHGEAGGSELFDQQREYLTTYRQNVAALAAGKPSLTETQKDQLEAQMLAFRKTERLMESDHCDT
jgi:glyoxylase-like metal-dependent hydrolase (beta-lactamase superfamily II)